MENTAIKGPSVKEEEPCAACAFFFSDYASQELIANWETPRALLRLVRELLEEGFGHFAKPAYWRWKQLKPGADRDYKLGEQIDAQTWMAAESHRIHDLNRKLTDADVERGVKHD